PMTTVPQLAHTLQTLFTTTADQLARQTGFVRRASKLTGAVFSQTVVFTWLADPEATLETMTQTAASLGTPITPQALDERFQPARAHAPGCPRGPGHHSLAATLRRGLLAGQSRHPLARRVGGGLARLWRQHRLRQHSRDQVLRPPGPGHRRLDSADPPACPGLGFRHCSGRRGPARRLAAAGGPGLFRYRGVSAPGPAERLLAESPAARRQDLRYGRPRVAAVGLAGQATGGALGVADPARGYATSAVPVTRRAGAECRGPEAARAVAQSRPRQGH